MKLILCIIRDKEASALMDSLIDKGFKVTKISSTGGFLRLGNTTLLLGVDEYRLETAIQVIKKGLQSSTKSIQPSEHAGVESGLTSKEPAELPIGGGATIFVMDVEKFVRY